MRIPQWGHRSALLVVTPIAAVIRVVLVLAQELESIWTDFVHAWAATYDA